jgi:hypothetical protein
MVRDNEEAIHRGYDNIRCAALDKSIGNLLACDKRNNHFFLTYSAPGVVTALLEYGCQATVLQPRPQEAKEDESQGEVEEMVSETRVLEEAVDELEGCFGNGVYPLAPEWAPVWDDRPAEDIPQEPPVDPMYCGYCLKTPCIFLQYHQNELERIVEIMYPEHLKGVLHAFPFIDPTYGPNSFTSGGFSTQ